ncbi:MAG: hypothetical protein DRJ15_05435 [Bacteroidetes bacterium]|nr:MAG: hypothetical protein DRJ15_05435 [Bacteroidota bacterium]
MEFLHPYWLFGLLAISIPIIIHLFNFRRYKKLYFTNLKFLKSIKNETRKQHRLRHLLILISRILAITFIVLAFARPYIPGPEGQQNAAERYVSIYVDNSMSMQAASNGSSLLDVARAKANEVLDAYGSSDRFQLMTNDFLGKHQRYYNRDEFNTLLAEVEISPAFRSITEVYERMQEAEIPAQEAMVHQYFISDFQKTFFASGISEPDTVNMLFYIPLIDEAYGNIYIDSCWFDSPYNHILQHQSLYVSLVNLSALDLEKVPVRLMINGIQRALGTFDAPAGGKTTLQLPFTNNAAGLQFAEVMIEDYPITWDDHFYINWTVKDRIPVQIISESDPGYYFSSLLANDSVFEYKPYEISKLDYSSFAETDLIVLDNISSLSSGLSNELEKFISSGGSLFMIPGEDAGIDTYNKLLFKLKLGRIMPYDTSRLMITELNARHELFFGVFEEIPENLDLPEVNGHYPFRQSGVNYLETIMHLQNGDPYLLLSNHGKGKVYLLTAPLGDDYGNLVRHAIWVPIIYRMAMLSRPHDNIYYVMGEDRVIGTGLDMIPAENQMIVRLSGSEYEFIPAFHSSGEEIELLVFDRIAHAGHYKLSVSGETIAGFSFNYNRMESDPSIYPYEELIEILADLGYGNILLVDSATEHVSSTISELSQGKDLWKTFIWLALFFILLEILLLRLFRK